MHSMNDFLECTNGLSRVALIFQDVILVAPIQSLTLKRPVQCTFSFSFTLTGYHFFLLSLFFSISVMVIVGIVFMGFCQKQKMYGPSFIIAAKRCDPYLCHKNKLVEFMIRDRATEPW